MGTRDMTDHQQLVEALNAAFSQKYHSLAQYILEARPYVPAGQTAAHELLAAIAAEDLAFADRIADAIEKIEGVPQLAIFSPEVANLNYLALDYLLQVLLKSLRGQLADYERFTVLAADAAPVRHLFTALAQATRRQIERLEDAGVKA